MGTIHFLNVNEGDCIWVQDDQQGNTIIDVCNARIEEQEDEQSNILTETCSASVPGNYRQKEHPVNPIEYFKERNMDEIFRFILTHPDMDHMDGIKDLFDTFDVINFWDTSNNKEMESDTSWGKYREEDWEFYQTIRKSEKNPKVLNLYSGATGQYYNRDENGNSTESKFNILSPTKELVEEANKSKDYNDASYVILYKVNNMRIIFAGDSSDKTWDYILENYHDDVKNIDILCAPHHGRKSGGNDNYLDVLNPKLTLFGNAKSKDLDYSSWNNRNLEFITNNQANCVILDTGTKNKIKVYVTYEKFAKAKNEFSFYSTKHKAWYIETIE